MSRSFADPETEFEIARSETPVSKDGYKIGEPKYIICIECGAKELITPEPSAGVDELQHAKNCPQRWVRSGWWQNNFSNDK